MFLASPMEQFSIFPILSTYGIVLTNLHLMVLLSIIFILILLNLIITEPLLVPSRYGILMEMFYNNCLTIVEENLGTKGRSLIPFIFTLYIFLIFINMISLVPYSFSLTAQISISFALSLSIWLGVLYSALWSFRLDFFSMFTPHGVPLILTPLIVIIECISFISRAISLAVRLAANLTAGHVLLAIISMFAYGLGIFGIFPGILLIILLVLETAVAMIQSFVFVLLTCIYLKDSLNLH